MPLAVCDEHDAARQDLVSRLLGHQGCTLDQAIAEVLRREERGERERERDALATAVAEKLAAAPGAASSTPESVPVSLETCDDWAARHFTWRQKQGIQTNADAGRRWREGRFGGRWGTWISPMLGHKCAARLVREDIEDVRAKLNEAIRLYYVEGKATPGATSWKNAMHIWSVLITACKQMSGAERDSGLRVRDDNPALGVPPPRRPAGMKKKALTKQKRILRPNEFLALVSHETLSLEWREAYAVLGYTYMRPGEARVLEWSDVDLATNFIRVWKAWNYETQRVEDRTKTGAPRDIPIEPTLRPLLLSMRDRAKGKGLVVPILSKVRTTNLSRDFRNRLLSAGVDRAELHRGSATEKMIGFRQLRDFGVTMRLWRGDNPLVVKRHSDHEDFETLLLYTVEIEKLTAGCGEPFPELPACLVSAKYRERSTEGTPNEGADPPEGGSAPGAEGGT